MGIEHLSHICFAGGKKQSCFHYVYHYYSCRINSALGEHSSLLSLVNPENCELSPTEACLCVLSDFVPMLWVTAVQSFYRGGIVEVSNRNNIWLQGIFLCPVVVTEPKRKWLGLPKWVHGLFRLAERHGESFLTCDLRFVADIKKMEVVPYNEALETQLLRTPAMYDSSEFSSDKLT